MSKEEHFMKSPTSQTQQRPVTDQRRAAKFLAALGTLLLVGATLVAARAFQRPDTGLIQEGQAPEHTAKAVAAAQKFLQGLNDEQRTKATYEFNSDKRP